MDDALVTSRSARGWVTWLQNWKRNWHGHEHEPKSNRLIPVPLLLSAVEDFIVSGTFVKTF
jgi:hypothetical protein